MSMFLPARTSASRFLASDGLALSRQVGARKGLLAGSPAARKVSHLGAKRDDKTDKSNGSEVVAEEPAVVADDDVMNTAARAKAQAEALEERLKATERTLKDAEARLRSAEEAAAGVAKMMSDDTEKPAGVTEWAEAKKARIAATRRAEEEAAKAKEAKRAEAEAAKAEEARRAEAEAAKAEEARRAEAEAAQAEEERRAEAEAAQAEEERRAEVGEPGAREAGEEATEGPAKGNGHADYHVEYKYTGPEPQRFTIAEGQAGQILGASLNPTFRLFSGAFAKGYSAGLEKADKSTYSVVRTLGRQVKEASKVPEFKRPSQPLELYEFEGCPFCKKVREAVSILDLDVMFYPCPKNGPTFRPKAIELGGKRSFPYLVDPGAGKAMYESDDIVEYLFKEYGDGEVPVGLRLGVLTTLSCGLALAGRFTSGTNYQQARMPEKPLTLWAYEGSPFCEIVKETLCELEIPHLMKCAPRGSAKRQELFEIAGHFQVPYLQDPNTGVAMFESSAIIDYLLKTYAI